MALALGALAAACSGTIDTPSEEYPARRGSSTSQAGSATTPTPAANPRPAPAAPAPAADDDDEPAAQTPSDDDDAPAATEPDPVVPAASGAVTFESDVWPIFQEKCTPCHAAGNLGGHNISSADVEDAFAGAVDFEAGILADIEEGSMPPGTCGGAPGSAAACVSADDFATIEAWYAAGAPE